MKILVPIDFSTASQQAFRYACFLANRTQAKITLLHVFEIPIMATDSYVYMPPPSEIEKIRENHFTHLRHFAASDTMVSLASSQLNYQCDYGIPTEQILEFSKEDKSDLIVMGLQGKCVRPNFFIGSTFANVMHRSSIPVIALHGDSKYFELKNILLTYDLNKFSNKEILKTITQLAKDFDAHIHVLNVSKEIATNPSLSKKLINSDFDQLIVDTNISFHVIQQEDILKGIKQFLQNQPIDLICLVPREHNIFSRLFNESITKKAAFDIDLPFMSIHN